MDVGKQHCTDGAAEVGAGSVLLTGFGPFGDVVVNASWEVVRHVIQRTPVVTVAGRAYSLQSPGSPVQVSYGAVDAAGAAGCRYGAPGVEPLALVIHVGVGRSGAVYLETQACNDGYCMPDCEGVLNSSGVCVPGGPAMLRTRLDVMKLQQRCAGCAAQVSASMNAGRYLCEYIYYKSLQNAQKCRTAAGGRFAAGPDVLFVHVPPLDRPYKLDALVETIEVIVQGCLEQLHERGAQVEELASLIAPASKDDAEALLVLHGSAESAANSFFESPEAALAAARAGNQGMATAPAEVEPLSTVDPDKAFAESLESLGHMGFDPTAADAALRAHGGDLQAAALALAS